MTSIVFVAVPVVLVAWAWAFARRARYTRGKADAYQQVADDFRGLSNATWWKRGDAQRRERKKHWLSLCLCDPRVCDALEDALADAREHWNHPVRTAAE